MQALYDVPAPAKLNLFLHVVGKRPDGYHLLQSLFVLIDWADTLHFERRTDGRLQRHDRGDALPADDLCLRAARALQQASGCTLGADIHIDKRLPSGAGMGGGSSDAASTLLALNRLWGLHWPRSRLLPIALTLGADVPFFVGGRNAFVEGIGEVLHPITLPTLDFAVVKPAVSIGTKEIFSSPLLQRSDSVAIVAGFPAANDKREADGLKGNIPESYRIENVECSFQYQIDTPVQAGEAVDNDLALGKLAQQLCSGWGRNDLQLSAESASSEVTEVLRWLQDRYGNSRMTGSGSAVFARIAVSADSDLQEKSGTVADPATLEGLPSGWVGRRCHSLDVHPLRGWADD